MESGREEFKKNTAFNFAGLIGCVILGFFLIILFAKRENTAGQIFSGQHGLQFITLFSLVISIAMFGVLGILEGKELAALLGAISGYVLGRVSAGEVQSAMRVPGYGEGAGTPPGGVKPQGQGPGGQGGVVPANA